MARKLKTYQTSLGFLRSGDRGSVHESGAGSVGRRQQSLSPGRGKESDDPVVIAATMKKPGVVLKRPVGSNGPFGEHAELPTGLGEGDVKSTKAGRKPQSQKPKKVPPPVDKVAERKVALAYEREQKHRDRERAREDAARQKERERREQTVDKAQAALSENMVDVWMCCGPKSRPSRKSLNQRMPHGAGKSGG